MRNRRSIIIFWTLLLVPALVLAGSAFRLLTLEQERIQRGSITALTDQAKVIAQNLDLAVSTIQDNLTRSLLDIDAAFLTTQALEKRLTAWEKSNPLIRNIFILSPEQSLLYPERSMASTREERQFIKRFDPLFTGDIDFTFNRPVQNEMTAPATSAKGPEQRSSLYALSREAVPAASGQQEQIQNPSQSLQAETGWIPWFSDNRLYILGWVQPVPEGIVFGVELEMMTLLSRLVTDFPVNSRDGTVMVLMDGNGNPIHRTGPLSGDQDPAANDAVARVDVSHHLPHWTLGVHVDKKTISRTGSFLALSLVLIGILITAILSAGVLITRLTLEKIKDARQKTSFVAAVSHELKTPLTSIRMYAELLLSKRVIDPSKKQGYLEVIVTESERLTRLINNVLDFGKLEQEKKEYRPVNFDMADFLKDLTHTNRIRLQKTGLKVITEFAPGPFPVSTDRDAMEQVVLNLLDNAIKYAGKGEFIKFILDKTPDTVRLTIQDDGPGIDPSSRKRIFEKFYRIDNSLTAAQPGSGLGLSIARQMLRDLGGDIILDPDIKQGAGFTIRIPIDE